MAQSQVKKETQFRKSISYFKFHRPRIIRPGRSSWDEIHVGGSESPFLSKNENTKLNGKI